MSSKSKRVKRSDLVQGRTIFLTGSYRDRDKPKMWYGFTKLTRAYSTDYRVRALVVSEVGTSRVWLSKSGRRFSIHNENSLWSISEVLDTGFTTRRAAIRANELDKAKYPPIVVSLAVQPMDNAIHRLPILPPIEPISDAWLK